MSQEIKEIPSTAEELEKYSCTQLKAWCLASGCPQYGRKDVLIGRIVGVKSGKIYVSPVRKIKSKNVIFQSDKFISGSDNSDNKGSGGSTNQSLLLPMMNKIPEAGRFVLVGQLTNGINLTLQSLLSTNSTLVGLPSLTKSQCYFIVVFFNMPVIHYINMSLIYGLEKGGYLKSFLTVAPLMGVMAFAGTAITTALESYTSAARYWSPLSFLGIGNVEWLTLLFVGVANFLITKILLAITSGVGIKKLPKEKKL